MEIAEDFLEQLLASFIVDRMAEIYTKDEEYRKRLSKEELIFQELSDKLSGEQAKELELYFISANSTTARKELLTYIQGMKDLLALLVF